jgi:hypothetical protein
VLEQSVDEMDVGGSKKKGIAKISNLSAGDFGLDGLFCSSRRELKLSSFPHEATSAEEWWEGHFCTVPAYSSALIFLPILGSPTVRGASPNNRQPRGIFPLIARAGH